VKGYNRGNTWQEHLAQNQSNMETTTPVRPAGLVPDLLVPLGQALVTGGLLASAVTVIVGQTDWRHSGSLGALWIGITLFVTALAWLYLLRDSRRLLWSLERLTGKDIDQDGRVGEPEPQTIEVVIQQSSHQRIISAGWLGLTDDQIVMLAVDLTRGRSLAEGDLGKDKVIFPRGINQYRDVRGKLVESGLLELVNPAAPAQGYRVTRAGRAVFKRLAQDNAHTHARTNGHGKSTGVHR
jgi:hypothetical protein